MMEGWVSSSLSGQCIHAALGSGITGGAALAGHRALAASRQALEAQAVADSNTD